MNDQRILAALLARVASLTAAVVFMTSSIAEAQLATTNVGLPAPVLGAAGG